MYASGSCWQAQTRPRKCGKVRSLVSIWKSVLKDLNNDRQIKSMNMELIQCEAENENRKEYQGELNRNSLVPECL